MGKTVTLTIEPDKKQVLSESLAIGVLAVEATARPGDSDLLLAAANLKRLLRAAKVVEMRPEPVSR